MGRALPSLRSTSFLNADAALYAVGTAPTPDAVAQVRAHIEVVVDVLRRWAAGQTYLNFAETRRDPHALRTDKTHQRLSTIKATVDPNDLIRSNQPVH